MRGAAKGSPVTDNAAAFAIANALSPVVCGSARSPEVGGGAHYKLKDGKTFDLTMTECRQIPKVYWDLPPRKGH